MAHVPFPWRGEDLPANAFWFRSGSDGWDFVAQRQTSDGGWARSDATPSIPMQNDDLVCYGMPVYAITDGEVVASWRNAPENPRPGESHAGRLADPPTIPRSGNFVVVLSDDGSVILYAHMVTGSVPKDLCPFTAAFVANADDKVAPSGAPNVVVPRETMLPASNRPRVSKGQFLGRTGNCGASSGPHLHMHRQDTAGNADLFTYDRAWMSDKNNLANWQPFTGQGVSATEKSIVILSSPLLRRGDATAGSFRAVAMHFVRSRRLITALRDASSELKLISWDLTPPEKIVRRGDIAAGHASQIAIAEPRSDIIVTALRDGDGNLRLISWRVESNGTFTRRADAVAGPVSKVALVTQQEGIVVAAVRTSDDNLKLIAWSVAPNGDITRRGDADADAGSISDVELAPTREFAGVVTAIRTGSGDLKLIAWQVSDNGNAITRRGDADAGSVKTVAVASRGNNRQFLLTAVRDSEDRLRVIAWRVADGGGSIERLSTAVAGKVSEVSIAGVTNPSLSAVVACRDNEDNLRLMTWELSSDGTTLTRLGGALAGEASKIAITGTSDSGRDFFVTACATSDGKLKLINWEANLIQ